MQTAKVDLKVKPENMVMTEEQKNVFVEYYKSRTTALKFPSNEAQSKIWDYKYWKTQPVKMNKEEMLLTRQIVDKLLIDDIELPHQFEWVMLDLNDTTVLNDVTNFLQTNYIEDIKGKFKLFYTSDFLKWSVGKNGFMIGLRLKLNKMLVATIAGTEKTMQLYNKKMQVGEVNFLCMDKRLRGKNLSGKMITKIKNEFAAKNVQCGFFTTSRYIPTPFSQVKFYHRPLNYTKLMEIGFMEKSTDKKLIEFNTTKYTLKNTLPSNVVKMTNDVVDDVYELFTSYVEKYNFHEILTLDEFKYWYINDFVSTYLILNDEHEVVDMFSYYKLKSRVVGTDNYVNCAYSFGYTSHVTTSRKLLEYTSIAAFIDGLDVLNVTNSMENDQIVTEPNSYYIEGTGELYYNMYNMETTVMKPFQMFKVTL